jgi:hypothetical protein
MLNKAVTKYSFLVGSGILVAAILLLTVGPAMSGTYKCIMLPSLREDRDWYCPTCGIAFAFCDIKPTPGYSGCDCAENFCAKWIDNDICDWNFGVHVCKAACKDPVNMPICSQVAAHGGVSSTGTPIQPFPFNCCGYVPTGGCCDENVDCATGKCNGFNANCPGFKACSCSNANEPCMSDKDCCQVIWPLPPTGLTCNNNPNPINYETKKICTTCTGKVYIGLSKYSVPVYEMLTAYTTGLDAIKCDGRPVSIKMNSCNGGTEITKCNYNKQMNRAECGFSIGRPGTYNIFACADMNGDGYFSDTESAMTYLTVMQYTTIPPQPRGGGGGGRMPLMMETSEGLNNPIVILVALIAIVVIIYGAFKFLAMPKKHR